MICDRAAQARDDLWTLDELHRALGPTSLSDPVSAFDSALICSMRLRIWSSRVIFTRSSKTAWSLAVLYSSRIEAW
jgi:hypothetical protein